MPVVLQLLGVLPLQTLSDLHILLDAQAEMRTTGKAQHSTPPSALQHFVFASTGERSEGGRQGGERRVCFQAKEEATAVR